MNISSVFAYPFGDKRWLNKAIVYFGLVLLSLFLVGIPFIIGYPILATSDYIDGKKDLPEWDGNWEKIFLLGLKYLGIITLIGLAYVFAVLVPIYFVYYGILFLFTAGEFPYVLLIVWQLLQPVVNLAISLGGTLIFTLISIRFAGTQSFSETMSLSWYGEVLRSKVGNLITLVLVTMILRMISGMGVFACVIGVILTSFYATMAQSALNGEFYMSLENKE